MSQDLYKKIEADLIKIKSEVSPLDKELLINSIQPAIGVKTSKVEEALLPIGTSKVGGMPDLPSNFSWPYYNNEPLAFCAQYNCQELTAFDQKGLLPSTGMLYVFVYIDTTWPGFLNKKRSFKVVYSKENKNLARTLYPAEYYEGGKFDPAKIGFFQYFTLPDDENYKIIDIRKKNERFSLLYDEMYEVIDRHTGQSSDNFHQLLGEDRSVQTSVVFNFAEKELNIRTAQDYEANVKLLNELKREYIMLLQLDCNDKSSTLHKYGGSAVIYFGIKSDDLKEKRFDKVIMAFQGT